LIDAIIFDLDGLLIDSEPFWEAAEMAVYPVLGVPLTPEMKKRTTGLRSSEIVDYWFSRYPWSAPSKSVVADDVVERVIDLVTAQGSPRDGVAEVLALCSKSRLPMAIASSSSPPIIEAALEKLAIRRYFQVIHSAQDEPYGKPHPGVYITTAQMLGVPPERCLAFEDSPNGVLAAKAAKMTCVAVPDPALKDHKVIGIADRVLESLREFNVHMLHDLSHA
jgi:mannitol-1-/sugar-/sorbitol-6-/2-deoxyglucose-6-phosphatase